MGNQERWYLPEGRIRRSTWLARVLGAAFGLALIGGLVVAISPQERGGGALPMIVLLPLALGFVVFRFIQDVKRLHDIGRSGAYIVFAFIPMLNLIYLVFVVFVDGQPHTNEYGPDPKGRSSDIDDIADVFR